VWSSRASRSAGIKANGCLALGGAVREGSAESFGAIADRVFRRRRARWRSCAGQALDVPQALPWRVVTAV